MSAKSIYRICVTGRSTAEIKAMIKLNPDVTLRSDAYTEAGIATSDINAARTIKRELQSCIEYAFQTERVARRNAKGRYQTGPLSNEWRQVRVVIEPDPDASRLLR